MHPIKEMQRILLFIIGLGLSLTNINAQWVQTDGPYEDINVLAGFEHDSKYFASAYSCGLFSKYPDEGRWALNSDLHIRAFTLKGDSLFADAHRWSGGSSRELGIYLFDLNNPEARPKPLNSLTANALIHSDSCLFGGNEIDGFFKLGFDGSGLEYFNEGLPVDTIFSPWQPPVYLIHVTAVALSGGYFFAGTGEGVYRSTHDLDGWEEVNNGLTKGRVTLINSLQDTLYAAISEKLYSSINEGISWTLIYTAPSKITSFQKSGRQLFVSTETDGVYLSADNGTGWEVINSGLGDLSVNFVLVSDSSVMCGTQSHGIFTFDTGVWKADNSGMVCSFIRDLSSTNTKLVALTDNHVYLQDGGSYTEITPDLRSDLFPNADHRGDTIFLSSYYLQSRWPYIYQSIFFSSDDGDNWSEIDSLPYTSAGGDSEHNIYINGNTLYAWSQDKLYFTDDMGSSWRNMNLPQEYCNAFGDFLVYKGIPFATTCGGELIRRNNSGQWVLSNNGFPVGRGSQGIAYCGDAMFTWVPFNGMYVSMDTGYNWSFAGAGLNTEGFGFRDFALAGQELYVVTGPGVVGTKDYGQNWYSCNTGLKNLNVSSLVFLNDTLYAGTYGNGIWKRAMNDISLSVEETILEPVKIKLYPNPASDYLVIESPGSVDNIEIIDLLGRPVKSVKPAGNLLDISDIPPGIYVLIVWSGREYWRGRFIISANQY